MNKLKLSLSLLFLTVTYVSFSNNNQVIKEVEIVNSNNSIQEFTQQDYQFVIQGISPYFGPNEILPSYGEVLDFFMDWRGHRESENVIDCRHLTPYQCYWLCQRLDELKKLKELLENAKK